MRITNQPGRCPYDGAIIEMAPRYNRSGGIECWAECQLCDFDEYLF